MTVSNEDQIAYWNGDAGRRWRTFADQTTTVFAPLTRAVLERAAPRGGERVLDVGCGCGATTIELARRVAPAGRVTGIDVSQQMLGEAERRVLAQRIENIDLMLADATSHPFPADGFDLLFSQFGVMFFADPIATFANLHAGLAPNARVTFSCWRPTEQNPWFAVPAAAVRQHVNQPAPLAPGAPGPMAFADPGRVRGILNAAGFSRVEVDPCDAPLLLGDDVDAAAAITAQIGVAARMIETAEPPRQVLAMTALRDELARHATPQGVFLTAGIWLVTAVA
jgi:SAM-dependent methyltransferase